MSTQDFFTNELFAGDAAARVALSLAHTLWQGVLIGGAALIACRCMRSRSAQARHLVFMAAIVAMALCLPMNLAWVDAPERAVEDASSMAQSEPDAPFFPTDPSDPGLLGQATAGAEPGVIPPSEAIPGSDGLVDDAEQTSDPRAGREGFTGSREPGDGSEFEQASAVEASPRGVVDPARWRRVSPWIVMAYSVGLVLALLRLIVAYRGGQRLRRLATPAEQVDPGLYERFRQQASRLGLPSVPGLGVLDDAVPKRLLRIGPVVIGVLRPMVLIPAAALTQMTPAQIEAVLAHELAHIRRHDPLFMLVQRAAETMLFFHPMLWLISRLASVEREHACDDLALRAGAKPADYADALLHLVRTQSSTARRSTLAAAALTMAQAPARVLEQRLARLFGQHIPNPLRLTRKGLVGLALVGLVGLTALITTTRAEQPGAYFAENEVIPALGFPTDGSAPHPSIPMQIQYVRPTHSGLLFSPDSEALDERWFDAGGHHALHKEDEVLRDIIIDLPDDAPELTFVQDRHRFEEAGAEAGRNGAPFFAFTRYQADGSRYIILESQFKRAQLDQSRRFDLTLAYYAGEQFGQSELTFAGPFVAGRPFTDTTGKYTTQLDARGNGGEGFSLTISLDRYLEDRSLIAIDTDGRPHAFTSSSSSARRTAQGGSGTYSFTIDGIDPARIDRILLCPEPRTTTFRNVALALDGWEDQARTYAPYLEEMAQRLGLTVKNKQDAEAVMRRDLTAEEAFNVIDIAVGTNTIMNIWDAIGDNVVTVPNPGDGPPQKRLVFKDYNAEQQAKIIAAAERWIDSSSVAVQRLGVEMGLWTGDMRFWQPTVRLMSQPTGLPTKLYIHLGRYLHTQLEPQHLQQVAELIQSNKNPGTTDDLLWVFRYTGTPKNNPRERRQATIDALIELAHDDRPEVWYPALSRFMETSWTMTDEQRRPMRETVLPKLAAESGEMLRRCAIVAPDAKLLGRPIPPRDQLRLAEVVTPALWREGGINTFLKLYADWIDTASIEPDQWELAINFLDQLDREWHRSEFANSSRDNTFIVEHIVQHFNASFDQNLGGLGQQRASTLNRKDARFRQIAREAVAWYHGPDGPRLHLVQDAPTLADDVVGYWRLDEGAPPNEISDAAQRNYQETQTLELRKDGTAVWQVARHYADDKQPVIDFKRLDGRWSLGDPGPDGIGGKGTGLYLTQVLDPERPRALIEPVYLGSAMFGAGQNHPKGLLNLTHNIHGFLKVNAWQPITKEEAAALDPGRLGMYETAEAFAAAVMRGDAGSAHALTHDVKASDCMHMCFLSLLDLPEGFGIDRVYKLKESEGFWIGFTPFTLPPQLTGGEKVDPQVLGITLTKQGEVWRVVEVDFERVNERFFKRFATALEDGEIEAVQYKGTPLADRIVGLNDEGPLDLHRAIVMGDHDRVVELFKKHGDNWVNRRLVFDDEMTPLHTAVRHLCYRDTAKDANAMLAIMRTLIERGADVNAGDESDYTAVSMLCGRYGYLKPEVGEVVGQALILLLEADADPNKPSRSGRVPLINLAYSTRGMFGRVDMAPVGEAAKVLIKFGADPDPEPTLERGSDGQTPIGAAIESLNPGLVAVLIKAGVDPNKTNAKGMTLLHLVCDARESEGNHSDEEGQSKRDNAAVDCAKILIEAGADPTIANTLERFGFQFKYLEATAYDIAPQGPLRDYLAPLTAPAIAKKRAKALAVAEAFVQAAYKDDIEGMLDHTPANWQGIYANFPAALSEIAKQLRDNVELDPDAKPFALPIEGEAVFMRGAAFLLPNKPGSKDPHTYIVLFDDGRRWRVLECRRSRRNDRVDAWVTSLFLNDARDGVIAYTRYTASGEVPPIMLTQEGKTARLPVTGGESATIQTDIKGQLRIDWYSSRQLEGQTYLSDPNAQGAVHVDHGYCQINHRDVALQQGLMVKRDEVILEGTEDKPKITAAVDGGLSVALPNGETRTYPKGTTIRVNLKDAKSLTYEVVELP